MPCRKCERPMHIIKYFESRETVTYTWACRQCGNTTTTQEQK